MVNSKNLKFSEIEFRRFREISEFSAFRESKCFELSEFREFEKKLWI